MIAVDKRDRDFLRFIWIDDVTTEELKFQIYRFTRVVFGLSASLFLLNDTVKYHLQCYLESHEHIVKAYSQAAPSINVCRQYRCRSKV